MLCSMAVFAQQDTEMQDEQMAEETAQDSLDVRQTYNHWSIDVGAGFHKPTRPFAPGAFVNTPSFFQAEVGARYMINNKFGFGLELGYANIENDEDSFTKFETNFMRSSFEGYINLGEVLGFRKWTKSFNILAHGGLGVSRISATPLGLNERTEWGSHATVGFTPQIRLSNRIALYGDLSLIGNIDQEITWDGTIDIPSEPSRGFQGAIYNVTVGVNIYLGSNNKHADWFSEENQFDERLSNLENEVEKLITDLTDDDQDGVPNYLDRDNDTESGVAVDSKGRAIDVNKNGIPDELESSLESRYATKSELENLRRDGSSQNVMEQLINQGYVNVFFQFNSTKVEGYSLGALNSIVTYMKKNPTKTATLTGYADEIGGEDYNQQLSANRAERIKEVMVAAGIDASRINASGGGEDTSVQKSSSTARHLVRRVTFRVQ